MSSTAPPQKIVLYSSIDILLPDNEIKTMLTDNLNTACESGSSSDEEYISDDELSAESGNRWRIVRRHLHFGYRHPQTNRLMGKPVKRTSDIPICDKVLTRNGNSELTSNEERVIRKLSKLLDESARVIVAAGAFTGVTRIGLGEAGREVSLIGDRPFPYFYARDAPRIRGSVFFEEQIYGDARKVTFVKTGGQHWLSNSFRGKIVYFV